MRAVALAAIIAVLAGGAGRAKEPAQAAPPVSAEDAHAGCLHSDLRQCMITLASALWFDMNQVAPAIAHRNDLDVNGRVAHRTIGLQASVPGHLQYFHIVLTLAAPAPNDLVVKTRLYLPADPGLSHTQAEYDSTQIYDLVALLLGNHCPALDRLTLYRFFENEVKPKIDVATRIKRYDNFSRTSQEAHVGPLPFCGVSFSYHRGAEWNGLPDAPGPRLFAAESYLELE